MFNLNMLAKKKKKKKKGELIRILDLILKSTFKPFKQ